MTNKEQELIAARKEADRSKWAEASRERVKADCKLAETFRKLREYHKTKNKKEKYECL